MTTALTLDVLTEAVSPGGSSCLTSTTELAPGAGPHAAIAPAKFAARQGTLGTYAYEKRYEDGEAAQAVIVDSNSRSSTGPSRRSARPSPTATPY